MDEPRRRELSVGRSKLERSSESRQVEHVDRRIGVGDEQMLTARDEGEAAAGDAQLPLAELLALRHLPETYQTVAAHRREARPVRAHADAHQTRFVRGDHMQ